MPRSNAAMPGAGLVSLWLLALLICAGAAQGAVQAAPTLASLSKALDALTKRVVSMEKADQQLRKDLAAATSRAAALTSSLSALNTTCASLAAQLADSKAGANSELSALNATLSAAQALLAQQLADSKAGIDATLSAVTANISTLASAAILCGAEECAVPPFKRLRLGTAWGLIPWSNGTFDISEYNATTDSWAQFVRLRDANFIASFG